MNRSGLRKIGDDHLVILITIDRGECKRNAVFVNQFFIGEVTMIRNKIKMNQHFDNNRCRKNVFRDSYLSSPHVLVSSPMIM